MEGSADDKTGTNLDLLVDVVMDMLVDRASEVRGGPLSLSNGSSIDVLEETDGREGVSKGLEIQAGK